MRKFFVGFHPEKFRRDMGIEHLPDGRIAIPGDLCLTSWAGRIAQAVGPDKVYTVRDVLDAVEILLGIGPHDFSRHRIG